MVHGVHCSTLWMVNVTVVVVVENINRKLSVVSPVQLNPAGDASQQSANDSDTVRRVMFESQQFASTRHSTAEPITSLINTIQAGLVMKTASFTLYSDNTALVINFWCSPLLV